MALSHGLCICNRWHCFMMKWLDGLQIMYWEKQAACILEFRELGEAAEMGILMLCEENWFRKLSRPLPTEKYREEGKWLSIQIIQDIVLAILFIFLALNGLWEKQKELYTLSTELLRRAMQGWCTIILSHEMSKSKKKRLRNRLWKLSQRLLLPRSGLRPIHTQAQIIHHEARRQVAWYSLREFVYWVELCVIC